MAILVRNELEFNLNSVSSDDDDGCFVMIKAKVQGSLSLFVNIYVPNST